jgi:hypothetical protein
MNQVKSILVCKFLGIVFMTIVQPIELFMPRKLLDSENTAWQAFSQASGPKTFHISDWMPLMA